MRNRKTNTTELLELHEKGLTVTELARHFQCSKANISKRLRRLILPDMPESLKSLTEKERAFVFAKVEGKSGTQAALEAYDCKSRGTAKVMANELLQKPDIGIAIADLMQQEGLTRRFRVKKLAEHVNHPNPDISLKALDQSWRLEGEYSEKRLNANVSWSIGDLYELLAELKVRKNQLEQGITKGEALEAEFSEVRSQENVLLE